MTKTQIGLGLILAIGVGFWLSGCNSADHSPINYLGLPQPPITVSTTTVTLPPPPCLHHCHEGDD
jgi:hypothetical protein